jgi:hypothetical protein
MKAPLFTLPARHDWRSYSRENTMQQTIIQPYWNICRRVYLVWAIIVFTGFIATHFYQRPGINYLWLALSLMGLGYMNFQLQQMRYREPALLYIGLLWLLTIAFGLIVSVMAFVYEPLANMIAYLGIFWLFLMGLAHILNRVVDPSRAYLISGGFQILAGAICFIFEPLLPMQYLVAGLVGGLAMVWLIVFR